MKKQVGSILDNMQVEEFKTVSDYLNKCYEQGFLGTMYDMHGQGIPLIFPMDQEAMVRAVQLDSKISKGLYTRLGEDVDLLKRKITAQVSRGISTGMSFQQVAKGLSDYTNIGFNNAVRIARTEGHRIQVQSSMDACYKAKNKGADIVKQWDAALDARTRESHTHVDGEIRELDKPFSNGLMFPGDPSGGAAEVVNCRCALLQRARWALDEDELNTLKERAEYYGLDKTKNFDDFKKQYLKASNDIAKGTPNAFTPAKTIEEAEQYAKQFVKEKTWSKDGDVSYKGIGVEHANIINETLSELYGKFNLPKLTNIKPMNFREKAWKGHEQAPAAYNSNISGGLFINPKLMKNQKTVAKYFEEGKKAFEYCKENIEKFTGKDRTLIETYLSAGRSLVSDDAANKVKAVIQHEIGHHIQNEIILRNKEYAKVVADGFDKYGVKISGYATKTYGEYIAESFCAYMNGEAGKIDPELAKIFEGLVK